MATVINLFTRENYDSDLPRSVRVSVDMPIDERQKLRRWCRDAAATLEVRKVSQSEVLRTVIDMLNEDQELKNRTLDVLKMRYISSMDELRSTVLSCGGPAE